jgi:hypothetical protein
MTSHAQHTGAQLALLDWKGTASREHSLATEGTGHCADLQRLRSGEADGEHHREIEPSRGQEGGLGSGTSEGLQAPRLLLDVHADGASALRETEGGPSGGATAPRRAEEGESVREGAPKEAAQEEVRSAFDPEPLTLGGFRPGTGAVLIPNIPAKWWKPCLTRAADSIREHCWFLSPTNHPSLYCPECRASKAARDAVLNKERDAA